MEPDRPRAFDSAPDAGPRRTVALGVVALLVSAGAGAAIVARASAWYVADALLAVALLLGVVGAIFAALRLRWLPAGPTAGILPEEAPPPPAARDPLTGFLNRRSLHEAGAGLVRFATRRDQAVALLVLDLDHFQSINDMHGQVAGDAVLRNVAIAIAAAMPPAGLTARLGGDSFTCAFAFDPAQADAVDRVADRLVQAIGQPMASDDLRCHVTCSIGIARSDRDGGAIEGLVHAADTAMRCAKRAGGDRHAWFAPAMAQARTDREDLASGLRHAVPAGQVVPWFEPLVELSNGRLTGFEVLARWTHPMLGEIPPDRFIPIAEEAGLIGELSLSVMRQAFAAARDWDPGLSLSINLSPLQLRDAWVAQKIIKTTVEAGFAPNRLEVEITESALFDNLALAQSIIGSLKNQGVRVALDDFGTGYSSLAHLRALPFDRIKIDRSFVLSLLDSADSAAIVKAIIGLGDSLNLPVTAEGVENGPIAERLAALGCIQGQGWAFGRAAPVAETRRMLGARGLLRGGGGPDVPSITSRRRAG